MKFFDLKSFYIVTDIIEHNQNKNMLLSLINKMQKESIKGDHSIISKTDWTLPAETKREYLDYFFKMIEPYVIKMSKKLKCNNWSIDNGWYQIYNENDVHGWHTHQRVNYSNVYYLHLPNDVVKTQLYDIKEEKIMDEIEVKEGQMFTFPAHIIHRSPPNNSKEMKAVIVFNSNFDNVSSL